MDAREKTLKLIAEISGVEPEALKPEAHLVADLGIDSARALHLLVKLEDELDIEIDDDEVTEFETVGNVLDFIARAKAPAGG